MSDPRRALPSVERLLGERPIQDLLHTVPRSVVVAAAREALAAARAAGGALPADWAEEIRERVARHTSPSLRPVLNATGIVLHTNLGRAPLAQAALDAMAEVGRGYSNLEYDLPAGARGSRADHCAPLLAELAGTEGALVVNNAASALMLALNALAAGREVLLSRGELIEIGGSFRIPEILEKSGATLREVGTTNRTHLDDYRRALTERTAALLTVHRSNFEQRGFVTTPEPAALATLAQERGVPYLYDLGSGLIADLSPWGLTGEPRIADGVRCGADLILFSGDKLLGGPQAGCLVGSREVIRACRGNPIARAVRADKFTLAGLEATLALYRDPDRARREVPVLRMLTASPEALERRACDIAARCPVWCRARIVAGESAVGGGSFPGVTLPTTLVAVDAGALGPDGLALRLRLGELPIVARIQDGRLVLDPRTLPEDADAIVGKALAAAGDAEPSSPSAGPEGDS
ncbi:MAG TPA: L-seryl-tRNA(Sec) selenium transferase [Gemmatimonadales bacterium]